MLSLLRRNREFRRLWLAHAISRSGDAFNTVAIVVLVFQLTGTGRGVAGAVVFEVLPVLLIGPVAGIAADKMQRRRLMVSADIVRAITAASLVVVTGSVPTVFTVAFVLSAAATVFNPAAASLLPDVVDEADLLTANSALWSAAVIAQIALAPAAGLVIAVGGGVRVAFAINAATFVVSALLLRGLRDRPTPASIEVRGWAGALAGVTAVRANPLLRRLAVVQVLASSSAGATSGLLVILAQRHLGVGPRGFGSLLAAIGVGAAIGPALLRRFIRAADRRWLFGPYLVRGAVDLTLATVANPIVAGASLLAYGMSTSTGTVAYQTTLQQAVPAGTRGRAIALFDILWNTTRLVSLCAGALLADSIDIRWVYFGAAALLIAAAAVGLTTPIEVDRERAADIDLTHRRPSDLPPLS